jgi:hypothetical protein
LAHEERPRNLEVTSSNVQVIPLEMGMLGMSLQDIPMGKKGYVKMPVGARNLTMAGGRQWVKLKVTAMEDVRLFRDVIVGNDQGEVKEHTPVELSYEKAAGGYQRVGELNPLPVQTNMGIYDDYARLLYTTSELSYAIGTNAHAADSDNVPLFTATQITLWSDNKLWVRFNGASRVQHYIADYTPYTFPVKCSILYYAPYIGAGYLHLHAIGVSS